MTRTRSAQSVRRKSCRCKKMRGGAAIATSLIADIDKNAKKIVADSGIDDVMDNIASIDADATRDANRPEGLDKKEFAADIKSEVARAKEIIKSLQTNNMLGDRSEIMKKVEYILAGKVRDVLPALDMLAKGIKDAHTEEMYAIDVYMKEKTTPVLLTTLRNYRRNAIVDHENIDNWIKTTRATIAIAVRELDPTAYIEDIAKLDQNNEMKKLKVSILRYIAYISIAFFTRRLIRIISKTSSDPDIVYAINHPISIGRVSISTILVLGVTAYKAYFWRKQWVKIKDSAK